MSEFTDSQATRLSIYSSIVSKILTIGVQFLSFPLAISALGVERFGVYVLITSVLVFFNLASFGIFPSLTRDVAKYVDNNKMILEYLFTAIKVISILSVTIVIIYIVITNSFSPEQLFGKGFSNYTGEAVEALDVALVFVLFNLIGSCSEATRLGMGKQYVNNCINIIANVLSFFLILYTAKINPTIMMLVISINGAQAISKLINLILLLFSLTKGMRNLIYEFLSACRYKELLSVGMICFLGSLAVISTTQGVLYMIGYNSGPKYVAYMSFIYRFLALSGGSVVMITQPLSAMLMKWYHKGEYKKIINSVNKFYFSLVVGTIVICGGILLFGQEFFILWSKGEVSFEYNVIIVISMYFFVSVWNHLIYTFMFSVGMTKRPVLIPVVESVITILLVYNFAVGKDIIYYVVCILASGFVVTSISYTYIFIYRYIKLKNLEQGTP